MSVNCIIGQDQLYEIISNDSNIHKLNFVKIIKLKIPIVEKIRINMLLLF